MVHPAMLVAAEVTRPIFQNIHLVGKAVFYVASTAAIAVFLYGWYRRVRKYRRGRPAGRGRLVWRGLLGRSERAPSGRADTRTVGTLASNTTVAYRDTAAGVAHFFIFWGFLVAFAATVILTIDYDIVRIVSKAITGREASFFRGTFFLVYTFVVDTFGFAFLVALLYMAVRRGVRRPYKLDYTRAEQPAGGYSRGTFVAGDWLFLGFLIAILVTAYLLTGLRILSQGTPAFTVFSPFGWLVAKAFAGLGMTPDGASTWHTVVWWLHAALALAFVAYLPYSKAMHIIVDMVNLLASDRRSTRNLPAPLPSEAAHPGYREIGDFTWKELLDLDACTKCGRCHEVCPARTAGAPLSPRDLILDLRQWVDVRSGGVTVLDREVRSQPTGPLAPNGSTALAGGVISTRTLWSCTTCMACVEACPVGIEHVPTIVELRRTLVDEGTMDGSLQQALQNLATQGNSFGKSARMRARWTKQLSVPLKDARKEPVKYLWFVGDYASFDDRLQENSRLLATLLTDAGVDFGILYDGEWNSGNDVRRVGEEGLYELLAEHNIAALRAAQFEEIFTTDPHTLNTLRNEYPDRGARYKVWHYTELLAHLVETGALDVRPLHLKVTYHDPCYLARYNGVTEAPRRLLAALGCELVEMPRNRMNTFCCGAGGGRIWMDDSFLAERPSENRIKEAVTLDVGHFVVSCPKDMTMYADAAKTTGHDGRLTVLDITRLVDMALVRPRAQPDEDRVGGPG